MPDLKQEQTPSSSSVEDVLATSEARIQEADQLLSQAQRLRGARERTLRESGASSAGVSRALSEGKPAS